MAHFDKSGEVYPTATLSCLDNRMKRVRLSDRDGGNKTCKLIDDKAGKECIVIAFWSSGSRADLHSYVVHSFCKSAAPMVFDRGQSWVIELWVFTPVSGD